MKPTSRKAQDEMRSEYDFDYATATRGKYCHRLLKEGANTVLATSCADPPGPC